MSFFPLFVNREFGFGSCLEIVNFPPNDWENFDASNRFICVSEPCMTGGWNNQVVGELPIDEATILDSSAYSFTSNITFKAVSLLKDEPPEHSQSLPDARLATSYPTYRSKISITKGFKKGSYQGEMVSFPSGRGSSLFFDMFPQPGAAVNRYLILLNAEGSGIERVADMEIFGLRGSVETISALAKIRIRSNQCNVLDLSKILGQFDPGLSIVFICRKMSVVPIFLAIDQNSGRISVEHTHPPMSLVVHGDRLEVQRVIKEYWFSVSSKQNQ